MIRGRRVRGVHQALCATLPPRDRGARRSRRADRAPARRALRPPLAGGSPRGRPARRRRPMRLFLPGGLAGAGGGAWCPTDSLDFPRSASRRQANTHPHAEGPADNTRPTRVAGSGGAPKLASSVEMRRRRRRRERSGERFERYRFQCTGRGVDFGGCRRPGCTATRSGSLGWASRRSSSRRRCGAPFGQGDGPTFPAGRSCQGGRPAQRSSRAVASLR